jgi:hypothetical protein
MEKPKLYEYVGSSEIKQNVANYPSGTPIRTLLELKAWLNDICKYPKSKLRSLDNLIIATFVIDRYGCLYLAERHSEHIACASGNPVLSAGEIFITVDRDSIRVTDITNQSTGYCPEPESWQQVAAALDRIFTEYPPDFSVKFTFRRCPSCLQINIVKDDLFMCEVCSSTLPNEWNF